MDTDTSAIVLAIVNLLNLSVSAWNARRLATIRDEQSTVRDDLDQVKRANGIHHGRNGA